MRRVVTYSLLGLVPKEGDLLCALLKSVLAVVQAFLDGLRGELKLIQISLILLNCTQVSDFATYHPNQVCHPVRG